MSTRSAGQEAERRAAQFLEGLGYKIRHRNYACRLGELDLVADDAGTCVFVEVRSRTGTALGHPLESITVEKRRRVIRSARLYLSESPPPATGYRFDVVAVTFDPEGGEPDLVHIPNAFEVA